MQNKNGLIFPLLYNLEEIVWGSTIFLTTNKLFNFSFNVENKTKIDFEKDAPFFEKRGGTQLREEAYPRRKDRSSRQEREERGDTARRRRESQRRAG